MTLDNTHDDVIKWKHFLLYWPFVQGIHQSPVNSPSSDMKFDVFFDLCLNKLLSKQSTHRWFEMQLCFLWCQCNDSLDTISLNAS